MQRSTKFLILCAGRAGHKLCNGWADGAQKASRPDGGRLACVGGITQWPCYGLWSYFAGLSDAAGFAGFSGFAGGVVEAATIVATLSTIVTSM